MANCFVTNRRIEFCETDAAGIIHFSSFFCYMEQAEHAFLRNLGTSVVQPLPEGGHLSWPRVHAECDFIQAVRFEDELKICLWVARLGNKSVSYRFDFLDSLDKLVAKGLVTAVCCRVGLGGSHIESCSIPLPLHQQLSEFTCDR